MATLLNIRDALRTSVGSPSTTDVPDADLNRHINDAYRDIAVDIAHPNTRKICSFVTVIGTRDYGLPTDVGAVLRVWDDTNKKWISKRGDREQTEWITTTESRGPAKKYMRFRDYIRIDPVSDGTDTIFIYYRERITDLSADGDIPVMEEKWHTGIRIRGRWYYYDEQGDVAKRQAAAAMYRQWLSTKMTEAEEESVDIDSGVGVPTLAAFQRKAGTSAVNFDTSL